MIKSGSDAVLKTSADTLSGFFVSPPAFPCVFILFLHLCSCDLLIYRMMRKEVVFSVQVDDILVAVTFIFALLSSTEVVTLS